MESIIIYGLKDPRDGQTYYIGKTHQPDIRFRQHLRGGENGDKDDWLDDLSNEGLMPEMETLEVVRAGADEHERESFWITFGLATGWPLTNRVIPAAQTIPSIRPEGTKQIRLQLDDELRRLVKVTAAQRGESIKEAGERLFRTYVGETPEVLLDLAERIMRMEWALASPMYTGQDIAMLIDAAADIARPIVDAARQQGGEEEE